MSRVPVNRPLTDPERELLAWLAARTLADQVPCTLTDAAAALNELAGRGLLVIKDVTSILSMSRDRRDQVLAALREIADGRWGRDVGVDGGKSLTWTGRIVTVGAVTTAWDTAHQAIGKLGDRFALVRVDSTKGRTAEAQPLASARASWVGRDARRARDGGRRAAAHRLFLVTDVAQRLPAGGLALPVHARRPPRRGSPARPRTARTSRGRPRRDVGEHPGATTTDVTRRVQKPRTTVDRALQELHLLGLLAVESGDDVEAFIGRGRSWRYSLTELVSADTLDQLRHQKWLPHSLLSPRGGEQEQGEQAEQQPEAQSPERGGAISGDGLWPTDRPPAEPYREPSGLRCESCSHLLPINYREGGWTLCAACEPAEEAG